jgi:anti-sigma factor RsiW
MALEKRVVKPIARHHHTCKDEVGLITEYLAGTLKPRVRTAFEQHLRQCPDCMAFLKTYRKTMELTASFLRMSSLNCASVSLMISPRVMSLITMSMIYGCTLLPSMTV